MGPSRRELGKESGKAGEGREGLGPSRGEEVKPHSPEHQ